MDPGELSLIVAGVSLIVAIISLGWNVVSWSRSGPRIKTATNQWVGPDGEQQKYEVSIVVRNNGRSPIDILEAGAMFEGGMLMLSGDPQDHGKLKPPLTVGPGMAVSVPVWTQHIRDLKSIAAARRTDCLTPFATLATGRTITSPPAPAGGFAEPQRQSLRKRLWRRLRRTHGTEPVGKIVQSPLGRP